MGVVGVGEVVGWTEGEAVGEPLGEATADDEAALGVAGLEHAAPAVTKIAIAAAEKRGRATSAPYRARYACER